MIVAEYLQQEFADGVAVQIYPTVEQVGAYKDTMIAENAKSHRVYTIIGVGESRDKATYEKHHQMMSFQKL